MFIPELLALSVHYKLLERYKPVLYSVSQEELTKLGLENIQINNSYMTRDKAEKKGLCTVSATQAVRGKNKEFNYARHEVIGKCMSTALSEILQRARNFADSVKSRG